MRSGAWLWLAGCSVLAETELPRNRAVTTFRMQVNNLTVSFERCLHETVIDAVMDELIYTFYHPEVEQQSLLSFQRSVSEEALQIKRAVCEAAEVLDLWECQTDKVSHFYESSSPFIAMWDEKSESVHNIIYRENNDINQVIDCYCRRKNCSSEDTFAALRGNAAMDAFHGNEGPFLSILKLFCGFSPKNILVVGDSVGEYGSIISEFFASADIFMIERKKNYDVGDEDLETQLQYLSGETTIGGMIDPESRIQFKIAGLGENAIISRNEPHFEETSTVDSVTMLKRDKMAFDLIKFSLLGKELLNILKGSRKTIEKANVIQLDVAFEFSENESDSTFFYDLHSYMDQIGFAFKDQGKLNRDRNGELISMTTFFVRKTSSLWDERCSLFSPRPGYGSQP